MVDSDAVKRLLEGDIEPSEIEDDPALYSMAERIYGREALEEMGVFAPEVETPEMTPDYGEISDDVSLPDFQPTGTQGNQRFPDNWKPRVLHYL